MAYEYECGNELLRDAKREPGEACDQGQWLCDRYEESLWAEVVKRDWADSALSMAQNCSTIRLNVFPYLPRNSKFFNLLNGRESHTDVLVIFLAEIFQQLTCIAFGIDKLGHARASNMDNR